MTERVSPYEVMEQANVPLEPPMLSGAYKLQLAEAGVRFDVVKVENADHPENGPFYIVTAELPGGTAKFSMSDPDQNPKVRDEHPELGAFWRALQDRCKSGAVVGPFVLQYIAPREGFPFFKLTPAQMPELSASTLQYAIPMDTDVQTTKVGKKV